MAKRINQMTTSYSVEGMAVIREDKEMKLKDFKFNSDTKNAAILKKMAADMMKVPPRDIMVTNIVASRSIHQYKINASVSDIIAACKKAGIEIIDLGFKNPTDAGANADTEADADADAEADAEADADADADASVNEA